MLEFESSYVDFLQQVDQIVENTEISRENIKMKDHKVGKDFPFINVFSSEAIGSLSV